VRWATAEHWAKRPPIAPPLPLPARSVARTTGDRVASVIVILLPVVVFAFATTHSWLHDVTALDIALFASLYVATMLGLTLGYHRLVAHQAFVAHPAVQATLLAFAGMAVFGASLWQARRALPMRGQV